MSRPRILCIGDLHYKHKNSKESLLLSNNLIEIANKEQPDLIVLMGDSHDSNNLIRTEVHVELTELMVALENIAPLIVIIGNHDIPGPNHFLSSIHPFSPMKMWQNTRVVDSSPLVTEVKGKKFVFVPYVKPGRFQDALDLCEWQNSDTIFCHQEFQGCIIEGMESSIGDPIKPDYPFIVAGHIHEHHYLTIDKIKRVLYVGTPRQVKIDESTYKTVSLLTYGDTIEEKRISTNLPLWIEKVIRVEDISTVELPESGRVYIKIVGTFSKNQAATKSPEVKKWKERGFTVTYREIAEKKAYKQSTERSSFTSVCRKRIEGDAMLEELFEEIIQQ